MDLAGQLEHLWARPDNAEAAIGDLQNQIVRMNAGQKPLAMSALFNKEHGILRFLRGNHEVLSNKAKYSILDFVAELLKHEYATRDNASEINSTCWLLFSSSKSLAAVKKSAVHTLVALVEAKLLEATALEASVKRYRKNFIQNQSKLVSSVKCAILELFGAAVRFYPDSFSIDNPDPDRITPEEIKRRLLDTISLCIKSASPDMELLAGSILGLGSYLHSFDATEAESKEIFATVIKMIIPVDNLTRYAVPRAGLIFIKDHGARFKNQMCSDRDTILLIHSYLKWMSSHANRDLNKLGNGAMNVFLQQVSGTLVERRFDSAVEIELFWHFVKDFIKTLNDAAKTAHSYTELSQAVRGLGLFAGPCKVLLPEKELKELQSILVRKLSSLTSGSNDAKYAHISAFMDAFKMIAHETKSIDSEFLNAIDELSISMMVNFPNVRVYYRTPLVKSFLELVWELKSHSLVRSFWDKIVKKLLVVSCAEVDQNRDQNPQDWASEAREPLWKDFVTFWDSLFSLTNPDWPANDLESFRGTLYDGMMTAILELPSDLNLSMYERETDKEVDSDGAAAAKLIPISADSSKLSAEIPKDFVIFVTYVSLCETILTKVEGELFRKWVFVAGQKMISYSSYHPLVSGFYKIFGVMLGITEKLEYFRGREVNEMDHDALPESSDSKSSSIALFSTYIEEVLLKMRQFKDDLLVSCLKMVLSSPLELTRIESLCLPIIESLKMGLSYTPLAAVALDAIESWAKKRDRKELNPAYARVLPSLNDYLMLDLDGGESFGSGGGGVKAVSKARSRHLKAHSVSEKKKDEQEIETLKTIQIRILKLLGGLGQDSRLMLGSDSNAASLLAWDTEKYLKVKIPFKEAIFDLYFDDMLPRIIELAEYSPDRKTKVAANELLHALIVVMIGGSPSHRSDKDAQQSPYHKIYVKLFPVLLRLAVDLDNVTRELFRPLVFQLIHWLTKTSKYENPETMAMLQSCFDAVASSNGPLREFGAECIAEFLKWTIKHSSETELERNPLNAKSLFKRLYLLCQHASASKRLAASIIINRIYTVFRESAALVEEFAMEILYYLLFSLKLADGDNAALGKYSLRLESRTQSLAKTAIDHLSKIIVGKDHRVFVKASDRRRPFPGVEKADLGSVTQWLFEESRQKQLEYSYKCIELFDKFASKLSGVVPWIQGKLQQNPDYVFELFESPAGDLHVTHEASDSMKRLSWLLSLRNTLIVYRYLLDRGALTGSNILRRPSSSGVVDSIAAFLNSQGREVPSHLSPTALKKWKSDNALFLAAIFTKLPSSDSDLLNPIFESAPFFELLSRMVFEPQSVGFDVSLQETKAELFNRSVEFVSLLCRHLNPTFKTRMIDSFSETMLNSDADLRNANISSRSFTSKYLQAVSGLRTLRKCGILGETLSTKFLDETAYAKTLLGRFSELSKSTDLLQIQLAGELLLECMGDSQMRYDAFKLVLCPSNEVSAKETYEKLADYVNRAICANPAVFGRVLMEGCETALVVAVLDNFVDWMALRGISSAAADVKKFMNHVESNADLVTAMVSYYHRTDEDVLTRFWLKFLQTRPDLIQAPVESVLSGCFWNEFFIGFNHKSTLKKLIELFDLLPLVLVSPKSRNVEETLSTIVNEKFPLVSPSGDGPDEVFDDYRVAMNKLIGIMERSPRSIALERVLILHLCRDEKHPFNAPFVESLSSKVANMEPVILHELCKFAFEFAVQSDDPQLPDLRLNVAKTVLLPALQAAQLDFVVGFFALRIKEIMLVLTSISPTDDETKAKHSLARKTICFLMMDIAYKRIPSAELHSATGRVLIAFKGPRTAGKELTTGLIKAGIDFKKKQPLESDAMVPYRLLLNQSAYIAVSACLLATQDISKAATFDTYLFAVIWENIVDVSRSVQIETDLDAPLKRVGIKEFGEKSLHSENKRKYLSTQSLADSSLSQMSSLFGRADARRQSLPVQSSLPSSSQAVASIEGSQVSVSGGFASSNSPNGGISGDLELDEINNNVCMKGIVSVIGRMPFSDKDAEMPPWMKSLNSKMAKPDTHINVRLFLAKIVINLPTVFAPFAKHWWRHVAQLIQDADQFGSGINYFVQDLCLILMDWTKDAEKITNADEEDGSTILKTLRWLVRHCNHSSKATIRNHLRIIRALVENWKAFVIPPTDVIFELLHAEADSKNSSEKFLNLTGIYVLQAFVANYVSPYHTKGLTDRIFTDSDLFDLLPRLLLSAKLKDVYSPLAECIGDVLAFLEIRIFPAFPSLLLKVEEACRRRFALETKSFVTIVNRISVNYPKILRSQSRTLLNEFSKLDMDLKGKSLEALLSWADEIPDLFTELLGLGLEDLLRSQDEECQTFLLGILAVVAPALSQMQISKFLPLCVELFLVHQSNRCRAAFFTLIHKLNSSTAVSGNGNLKHLVKFALLKGLNDPDAGIRTSLFEFFNNTVFKDLSVFERAVGLISEWFIPEAEDAFLKYCVFFLLEATRLTPVYDQKIHDKSLPDATFIDKEIVVDSPAFSMQDRGGMVQMTQEMAWTPTQDINGKSARNVFSRASSEFENQTLSTQPGVPRGTVFRSAIRRSYTVRTGGSSSFAYDAERKKKEARDIESFKRASAQRNVALYRKYREGELPDIEIKHKDLLEPLQSLSNHDNDISRHLLSSLISQMASQQRINSETLGRAVNAVFTTSSALSPPLIGSLLQLVLSNSELIQHSSPDAISHVASGSANFELGVLILEKGIQDGQFVAAETKRSKTAAKPLKRSPEGWVPLARLFKELKLNEVYESVYEFHIASSSITKEAIAAELLGDYETAKIKYTNGLSELQDGLAEDVTDAEPKLWRTQQLECMNRLAQWGALSSTVLKEVGGDVNRLWDDDLKGPYLASFLRSNLKLSNGKLGGDLLTGAVFSDDFNLSRHYVDLSWKQFVSSFADLNASAATCRIDMMASLQPIREFDEFLSLVTAIKAGTVDQQDLNAVTSHWRARFPAKTDSIAVWDDLIVNRKVVTEKILGMLAASDSNLSTAFQESVDVDDLLYSRQIGKAAGKQGLYSVASRWLTNAKSTTLDFDPEFMQQYFKHQLLESDRMHGVANKFVPLKNLLQHLEYNKAFIRATSNISQSKFAALEVRVLSRLTNLVRGLSENDSFFSDLAEMTSKKSMKRFFGKVMESKQDLLLFFLHRSARNVQSLHELELPVHNFKKGLLEIGMFVDKTLRALENDPNLAIAMGRQPESAKLIVQTILRAMVMGSEKATDFFPRLLQLLDQYPELYEEFKTQSRDCPAWMFLRWLPQLTSLLDKPSGLSILPLVRRIAETYPNALRLPLTISCEQYRFNSETNENSKLVDQLKHLIRSNAHDRLALELRRLEDPTHIFKDLCDRFQSLLDSSVPTKAILIQRAFDEFKQICLEKVRTGDLVKKFAEKHDKISSICANGANDSKKLKELLGYGAKFGVEAASKPGRNLLKSFSVWLDEYQMGNVDPADFLEIPGQYTGAFEHRPAEHGGEDLRLDQRIEQMFSVMNEMMERNPYCLRNRISLVTYKVVPMSTSLGVIEWVDGTKPLKACMANSPSFDKKLGESQAAYAEFVAKHGTGAYYDAFLATASSKSVISNIESIWNKNRDSFLKEFFIKLTVSPEAFFQIRSEFANSLSALNICSYFLGIGDRHLDNFLVDLRTGRIVGIDFGHAFGSATEVLPVPELVPFRLTDQIQKFLLPLGVHSLMAHPMTNVLSSIQDDKERLLNALNIFVNEPLVEWRKFAVKQMKNQGKGASASASADSLTAPEWYPQQKLEIAKRKLDGENPAFITATELALGHEKKKWFKQTKAALMGDPGVNVRAKVGKMCQTPREQVDCLIDLAMDPNVLGRAWIGWSPFM
ncbi:hypothetical protein HDU98_002395 [Podochytrium sp. JEL0797]|nr:hypothetical protein HDU98_002395 [Podochytrium sp. JEL0797]